MKGGGPEIPDTYTFSIGGTGSTIQVDADLDNIRVREMPRFEIAVTEYPELTVNSNVAVTEIAPLTATTTSTVDADVDTTLAITQIPPITSNLNIAVKEIPEQRVHYPAHYQLGFTLFGIEIWSLSLCGESQVINEKYVPRRTEICK